MLKFEGLEVGTKIRAYDFEPRDDFQYYVEGVITEVDPAELVLYPAYRICVFRDTLGVGESSRVGQDVFIPMESFMDYDGRISTIDSDGAIEQYKVLDSKRATEVLETLK